jgi:flagellar motility protein MotE (MotC chaperone)
LRLRAGLLRGTWIALGRWTTKPKGKHPLKTIVIASLVSLFVIVGGYLVYLKKMTAQTTEVIAAEVTYDKTDIEAIQFAMQAIEKKRSEVLTLEANLGTLRSNIAAEKEALVTEQDRLKTLIDKLALLQNDLAANEEQSLARLAKMYEMMKPNEAAEIASQLDVDLLVKIVPRMKERAAAKLISALDTSKAVQITQRLGTLDLVD